MKIDQMALPHPPMSSLRMMSPKIVKINMIQMKKRKNQRRDQRTWPVPNSAASSKCVTFLSVVQSERPVPSRPIMAGSRRMIGKHARSCTSAMVRYAPIEPAHRATPEL